MSIKRAVVVPFEMLPHHNADALSVVRVGTTQYVARTEDWQGVTRAVYIPAGSTVDTTRPEFAWLAHKGPAAKVEAMKIRGVLSEGLMVRVPDETPLGEDWTDRLGVVLPEETTR